MTTPVLQQLKTLLRPEQLLLRSEQLAAYQSDGLTAFHQTPLAVAIPETTDEVVALVRLCHKEIDGGLPIIAGGVVIGGIGISGGTSAQDGQVAAAGLAALGC